MYNITPLTTFGVLLTMMGLVACDVGINEDIYGAAGTVTESGGTTVNGNVVVGRNAVVEDGQFKTINGNIDISEGAKVNDCTTVNGSVTVAKAATTGRLATVNGNLRLAESVRVLGDIKLVNGEAWLQEGSIVEGDLNTIHGKIQMAGATVTGNVTNYSGGIRIMDGSVIEGSLRVRKPRGYESDKTPTIIIGRDSEIHGSAVFERPVRLFIHQSARIGNIQGAEPVSFSGDEPDQG